MALRGRRQLIFVTGEAGIGKTMLVDAFHHRATCHQNVRMARGQCVEGFGGKEAYYPMLEALGQLIRDTETSPVAQALAKCAPTWWIQFPSLVKSEKREALQREILGATRERMVREICETLEVITAENPLVLILEDLHWVDPSTLDLISALARRREPAKLMLLATYRPTDVALSQTPLKGLKQDLQVHHLATEIALERLEEATIAEYLATEFPKASLAPGPFQSCLPTLGRKPSVHGSHCAGHGEERFHSTDRARMDAYQAPGRYRSWCTGDSATNAGSAVRST